MKTLAVFLIIGLLVFSMTMVLAKPSEDSKCFFKDGSLKPNAPSYCTEIPEPPTPHPPVQPILP